MDKIIATAGKLLYRFDNRNNGKKWQSKKLLETEVK